MQRLFQSQNPVQSYTGPHSPLYLSGAHPPGLLLYSTRHTCRLPLLLLLATDAPSSTGHTLVMRPDWPAYVSLLANDTSRSNRRMSHTCSMGSIDIVVESMCQICKVWLGLDLGEGWWCQHVQSGMALT
jgi:hypothetical protein